MSFADSVVFFGVFCCQVERSKALQLLLHVVVGPLWWERHDECVSSKEICTMLFVGGCTLASGNGGRGGIPWTRRKFDCTMGYPGEDVCPRNFES